MWGAVVGDIVGSRFEFAPEPKRPKDFEFLHSRCHFTDDSVCTAGVADSLLHARPPAAALQDWCRRYPDKSYGASFVQWIQEENPRPYGSCGNGAAMRVSPAAFLNRDDLGAALAASDRVTAITHDHPEGMKGARATTHAVWLAFRGEAAGAIRAAVADGYGYDLSRSVDQIRPDYRYSEICQQTVPEALTCALESTSFEDAVRSAVSLGGDADTLAAIAGAVAEALHGIPKGMADAVRERYLGDADDIAGVMEEMYGRRG